MAEEIDPIQLEFLDDSKSLQCTNLNDGQTMTLVYGCRESYEHAKASILEWALAGDEQAINDYLFYLSQEAVPIQEDGNGVH